MFQAIKSIWSALYEMVTGVKHCPYCYKTIRASWDDLHFKCPDCEYPFHCFHAVSRSLSPGKYVSTLKKYYIDATQKLEEEIKRLKAGNFTAEELRQLINNGNDYKAFTAGCTEYQWKFVKKSEQDNLESIMANKDATIDCHIKTIAEIKAKSLHFEETLKETLSHLDSIDARISRAILDEKAKS